MSDEQKIDSPLLALAFAGARLSSVCSAVPPRVSTVEDCVGCFVASNVVAAQCAPARDVAARDGFAFSSEDLVGASSFSPAFVLTAPQRVCVGQPLPDGCDCVIDAGCVDSLGPPFAVSVEVCPGEGARRAGAAASLGAMLLSAGSRVSRSAIALLKMAGVNELDVRRACVRLVIVPAEDGAAHTAAFIAALLQEAGVELESVVCASRRLDDIAPHLAALQCDLLITLGGTGTAPNDQIVHALRGAGASVVHGLALAPGSTIAVGVLGSTPVIALPGRFDSALSGWLALVAPALQSLCGARPLVALEPAPLTRKISSAPGMSEIVLLERTDAGWAPSGAGEMSLSQALRASGYLVIGSGSEGLAEGALVRPLPLRSRQGDDS
jgi:molybdopterin biosynthesis enzyme